MKSKEQIEQLAERYADGYSTEEAHASYIAFQDGYTQCQEDMADKKYTEEDINEMACDFVINVGGLPKTIEEWQNALWKFYQSLNKQD
jgi:hypothetical protein